MRHLTAQLADGRAIEFSGYAGGPLLLVMAVMAALISVLSMALLGGVSEVAVAANTLTVGNSMMKDHLQSAGWVDAAKFPEITFEVKSTDPAVVPVTRVSTPLT